MAYPLDFSYNNLPHYLHQLKYSNPHTVAKIQTEIDGSGHHHFKYVFLLFAALHLGFRMIRDVIVLDAKRLTGRFRGVLLTACAEDANLEVYPLAFAIVDSDNDAAWLWFLRQLAILFPDTQSLTYVSVFNGSIRRAKNVVFPNAHFAPCTSNLNDIISSRYKDPALSDLFVKAAHSFTKSSTNKLFRQIKEISSDYGRYLDLIGMDSWCREYFKGQRFNLMLTNMNEQLNVVIAERSRLGIIPLVDSILTLMNQWFSQRRSKSRAHIGNLTPAVAEQMLHNEAITIGTIVMSVNHLSCELVDVLGNEQRILINEQTCTYKAYDKLGIPCGHALLAAGRLGLPRETLLADYFRTTAWVESYRCFINPIDVDFQLPPEFNNVILNSPLIKCFTGRPKVFKSITSTIRRCPLCKREGHNARICPSHM